MKPLVFCPDCNGDGYIEVEKVAPWIDLDTPPDLVSYKKVCELCLGEGKIIPEEKEDGN